MVKYITVVGFLLVAQFAFAEEELGFIDRNFAYMVNRFPKHIVTPNPWAGFWFPYSENGIASTEDLNKESPAEKYDQVRGSHSTRWEKLNHGIAVNPLSWWGHCNGWAAASILETEPREARNISGVRFDVGDRKGLLTEVYQDAYADFIGTRMWTDDTNDEAFWDLTPAQFHLLITNIVGKQNRSFIFDRNTGAEVWNQPVVAYRIRPVHRWDDLGRHPDYDNVYRVNVTVEVWWVVPDVVPFNYLSQDFNFSEPNRFIYQSRILKYELWLDGPLYFDENDNLRASGDIISGLWDGNWVGGYWKNGHLDILESHPDFAWIPIHYSIEKKYGNPYLDRQWVVKNLGEREHHH